MGRLTTDLHPDGTRLVAAGAYGGPSSHLEVFDLEDDVVLWSWDVGDHGSVIDRPRFTPDGGAVVAAVLWEPDGTSDVVPQDELGVFVWDASTGAVLGRHELGVCGGMLLDVTTSSALVQTLVDGGTTCWADAGGSPLALELVDLETGSSKVLSERSWGREAAISGDGRRVAVTEDTASGPATVVLDVITGERRFEFDRWRTRATGTGSCGRSTSMARSWPPVTNRS